jgi:hypothetical protein
VAKKHKKTGGCKFLCMEMYVGMTPKITPQLLIWNMMLELKMEYDEVNNGQGYGGITRFGKT